MVCPCTRAPWKSIYFINIVTDQVYWCTALCVLPIFAHAVCNYMWWWIWMAHFLSYVGTTAIWLCTLSWSADMLMRNFPAIDWDAMAIDGFIAVCIPSLKTDIEVISNSLPNSWKHFQYYIEYIAKMFTLFYKSLQCTQFPAQRARESSIQNSTRPPLTTVFLTQFTGTVRGNWTFPTTVACAPNVYSSTALLIELLAHTHPHTLECVRHFTVRPPFSVRQEIRQAIRALAHTPAA